MSTSNGFWMTRDRNGKSMTYSIWTVEPKRNADGHWTRSDFSFAEEKQLPPVRMCVDDQIGEKIAGRELKPGEKVWVPTREAVAA